VHIHKAENIRTTAVAEDFASCETWKTPATAADLQIIK